MNDLAIPGATEPRGGRVRSQVVLRALWRRETSKV